MRYLQIPKIFHIPTPSLPFRHRSTSKTVSSPDQLPSGQRGNGTLRAGPRASARGFAVKFYDILSQESSDIISWTPSGLAFQVVDYTRFSEEILLKYFRHNKFSSFRRQLNLYGYRKVIKGPDAGAYMHPSFQRGRPDLLLDVKKGKVPHYDVHGINEIHGQHFRHHPPGAKAKDSPTREPTPPTRDQTHLSPMDDPQCPPVTPEMHGEGYTAQMGLPLRASPARPSAQGTPSLQAMMRLSNMSLGPLESPGSRWAGNGQDSQQVGPQQTMDALTLTPAWGGVGAPGGVAGEDLRGGQGEAGKVGGGESSDHGSVNPTGVPMAYWNKQMRRRTLSSQVVFPTQAPKDTEEIWNPDPNMCDVMDVICQCMEVRSSTEEFSSCSFNNDCKRHSSINDLLSIMSWESALRTSNTTGRSSLGTALDSVLAAGHEGGDSRSLISNTIDNSGVGGGNNADADVTFPSRMSLLDQKPSFDPSRDPVEEGSTAIIKSMLEPAAVTAESVPMIMPAQQDFNHRPSFDPNHELTIATDIYSGRQAPVVDRGPPAAQVAPDAFAGGGNTGTASATPGMSRETSRGSRGVARIFKSAPTRPPVKGGTWKGGGVGEGHQWSDGGRDSSDSVGTATSGTVRWDASLTSTGATSTADTTTWGLPGTPTEGDADTSRMSMSPPRSRVTPPSAEEGRADVGAAPEVFTRPTQTRMPSLLWVKEPKPERRPTIRESQEMNLKLSNQANAAAWRRVTGDSDTTMVLTNIGSFLG